MNERAAIARDARNQSKEHTHDTAADIMDVTSDEVTRVMAENDVHLLIHGHTHRPGVHDLLIEGSHARRIVLGDWGESGWYLKLDGKSQDLVSFEIGS